MHHYVLFSIKGIEALFVALYGVYNDIPKPYAPNSPVVIHDEPKTMEYCKSYAKDCNLPLFVISNPK